MKLLIYLSAFLLILSGTKAQTPDLSYVKTAMDKAMGQYFKPNAPGGSVFIEFQGNIIYKASFGLSDLKRNITFSDNTIANTGSVSKTFVAYAILKLQEEGKLSIEDNLLKYFPDFKNQSIAEKIKIKHLITHTSGLPDSRQITRDSIFYLTAKDVENFAPLLQTDALEFEPGSRWNYSNPAYNGLALIIEKLTGKKWQKYVEEKIFKPAKMRSSVITDGAEPSKGVAHGYRKYDGEWQEYDYGEYPTFCAAGNGGIWSSVDDLIKYTDAISEYKFLPKRIIDFSQTAWRPANWKGAKAPTHGYCWFVHTNGYELNGVKIKEEVIEHTGDQGGFRAHVLMIPSKQFRLIWLTNGEQFLTGTILKVLRDNNVL
jgi:CubicO group peptidase (beta-lactamase class C family)